MKADTWANLNGGERFRRGFPRTEVYLQKQYFVDKKSRIRETLNLSTDVESITIAMKKKKMMWNLKFKLKKAD